MGRNSRARREARQSRASRPGATDARASGSSRAGRQTDGGEEPGRRFGAGTNDTTIADLVIRALTAAVDAHAAGDPTAARRYGVQFTSGAYATAVRAVDTAIGRSVQSAVSYAWSRGWLPRDVYEGTRRRASELAVSLVGDGMAAEAAKHAVETIDPHWTEQLESIDAQLWWDGGRPHLSQWCGRHGVDRAAGLETVVELIATLSTLPQLPVIHPLPGQAHEVSRARPGVDEKMLGRVRALLAKAESTGFPEEAESLSAKAQELMSRYAIERAMLDVATHEVAPAGARRVWLEQPYVSAKTSLVGAVAAANRCRAVVTPELGFVTIIGDDLDLQIVELLTTSLMVQATAAMVGAGARTGPVGQSRTRSFRHAFLLAYAHRVGERLRARAEETVAAAGRELVPVLAERERVIGDTFERMFPRVRHRSVSVTNSVGWVAGRAAADTAVLHVGRDSVGAS